MLRRLGLPVLTLGLIVCAAIPASAAPRRSTHVRHISRISVQAEGHGTVIAVTYASGPRQHVKFLHSSATIDRVALTDVDRDGEQDIIAAPRNGDLLIWRNRHGRLSLSTLPRGLHPVAERGPRFVRFAHSDEPGQWTDERYDAAMPRAPSVVAADPVALVSVSLPAFVPLVAIRSSSGRAPPSLA